MLRRSDASYKSSFFFHYFTHLYDGEQLKQLLVPGLGVTFSSVLPLRSNQILPYALWHLMISAFSCDSSTTPAMSRIYARQIRNKVIIYN